ncbi:uncharacterized protein PHACADRAFT_31617 [Phanerochaete carnosa HHB-10118-sp]|uniref:Uncharacterized protein n=1 Tax=Phanerochaete carnosa (strain HHB-10118-sp) TaxID=650164 RepID=K5WNE7_PHACS|nr:uncharacterized protein PHACADRAFT_31617 [Phanerochaete carnosa HHB-10118-sp]EKM51812.1 hypothetical protein PHACADRAFT_31617 [Phanerochaete carnosa HHB-10118-sp]
MLPGSEVGSDADDILAATASTNPSTPPTSTISLADVLRVRMMLQSLLPIELIEVILHDAEYYSVVSRSTVPRNFTDSDIELFAIILNERQGHCIQEVSVLIRGHDQGWSSYPQDRGTYRNSWTWYTLATLNPHDRNGPRLATNRHADRDTQTHEFRWGRRSQLVQDIKGTRMVALWAHARYPGWQNFVEEARLVVALYPRPS